MEAVLVVVVEAPRSPTIIIELLIGVVGAMLIFEETAEHSPVSLLKGYWLNRPLL